MSLFIWSETVSFKPSDYDAALIFGWLNFHTLTKRVQTFSCCVDTFSKCVDTFPKCLCINTMEIFKKKPQSLPCTQRVKNPFKLRFKRWNYHDPKLVLTRKTFFIIFQNSIEYLHPLIVTQNLISVSQVTFVAKSLGELIKARPSAQNKLTMLLQIRFDDMIS